MTPKKNQMPDPIPAAANKLMLVLFLLGVLGMGITLLQMNAQEILRFLTLEP